MEGVHGSIRVHGPEGDLFFIRGWFSWDMQIEQAAPVLAGNFDMHHVSAVQRCDVGLLLHEGTIVEIVNPKALDKKCLGFAAATSKRRKPGDKRR